MHDPSLVPALRRSSDGHAARHAGAVWLAEALRASRADTLATFALRRAALPDSDLPQDATFNPALWELGHLGWFQEFWVARNPERALGSRADPDAPRRAGVRPDADALYDSSRVAHATRWSLPLPDADATVADLAQQLETTLGRLADTSDTDPALYFFRLALLHEDMHHEAALMMAQSLGIAVDDPRWQAAPLASACRELAFDAGPWRLGSGEAGFAFDNELGAHDVGLPATRIDSRVVRWAEYLPFVESGGYANEAFWCDAGRAWRVARNVDRPRHLHRDATGTWQQWRYGRWSTLDSALAACHLGAFEAEAWCRWAGRRLPTEAEWERAAVLRPAEFDWGTVWEWTSSPFLPYPGFVPHPYRDYSAPWFADRRVLRGASSMTQPRMRHPRYRNFFGPERDDVAAGFRSCAL